MSAGKRIRTARENKGLSQARFAELVRASTSAVSSWETDRTKPKPKYKADIARVLGISLTYLEFGEDGEEYIYETADIPTEPRSDFIQADMIAVQGYVGATPMFIPSDDDLGEYVPRPSEGGDDVKAVRVWGDSMAPYYPAGSTLFFTTSSTNIAAFVGDIAICRLSDGTAVFKEVKVGSRAGLYTLKSANPDHDDIVDATIERVFPVIEVRRA